MRLDVGDPKVETMVRRESIGLVKLKVAVHPGAASTTARVLINGKPCVSLPIDVVD